MSPSPSEPLTSKIESLVERLRRFADTMGGGASYLLNRAAREAAGEIERLQHALDQRNEQIDGYERQLGILNAGADRTIGSEIERLMALEKVADDLMRERNARETKARLSEDEIHILRILGNDQITAAKAMELMLAIRRGETPSLPPFEGALMQEPETDWRVAAGVPRRACVDKLIPEEHAIRNAMIAVEALGGHPLLTDVVTLLDKARDKLAEWHDGGRPGGSPVKSEAPHVMPTVDKQP